MLLETKVCMELYLDGFNEEITVDNKYKAGTVDKDCNKICLMLCSIPCHKHGNKVLMYGYEALNLQHVEVNMVSHTVKTKNFLGFERSALYLQKFCGIFCVLLDSVHC